MAYDVFDAAFRIILLTLIPILAATSLASLLIAVLQTSTSIHEPAVAFSVRLVALILALYFVLPSTISLLIELLQMALS